MGTKVVELLKDLEARVKSDGEAEQKSYDKYACWCEDTMSEKAKDITKGKTSIDEYQTSIVELKAGLATHGANIEQLKKDIKLNVASQRLATDVRNKEHREYTAEKEESEQCIGALDVAIGALAGTGTGKKGFLETLQEAQLISAAAGVKSLLASGEVQHSVSDADIELVHQFVDQPEEFVGNR